MKLIDKLNHLAGPGHMGSDINQGDCAVTRLGVTALESFAQASGPTLGLLFADIAAAFPNVLRAILFDNPQSDEAL